VKQIYIYGASGHGKVVADIARANGYTVAAFVDDDKNKTAFGGLPCIRADEMQKLHVALGIGSNNARKNIYNSLKQNGFELPPLIHPSAIVSESAKIAEAVAIMPNCVINADANVGIGCIVNSGAVIEHDCILGDFVHISPNAALAGGVQVGEMSHIGIGASVIQLITIGKNCLIGAGAAVISNIKESTTAVGVPAKVIKDNR